MTRFNEYSQYGSAGGTNKFCLTPEVGGTYYVAYYCTGLDECLPTNSTTMPDAIYISESDYRSFFNNNLVNGEYVDPSGPNLFAFMPKQNSERWLACYYHSGQVVSNLTPDPSVIVQIHTLYPESLTIRTSTGSRSVITGDGCYDCCKEGNAIPGYPGYPGGPTGGDSSSSIVSDPPCYRLAQCTCTNCIDRSLIDNCDSDGVVITETYNGNPIVMGYHPGGPAIPLWSTSHSTVYCKNGSWQYSYTALPDGCIDQSLGLPQTAYCCPPQGIHIINCIGSPRVTIEYPNIPPYNIPIYIYSSNSLNIGDAVMITINGIDTCFAVDELQPVCQGEAENYTIKHRYTIGGCVLCQAALP